MSDIVLVFPKTGSDIRPSIAPPHPLLSIAAYAENYGYSIKIIDQRLHNDWRMLLRLELAKNPLLLGITAMTGTQIHYAVEAAKVARHNGSVPIVWGGKHATITPEQTLESEWCDIVCIGEGDYTLAELANCISSKIPLSEVKGIAYKDGGRVVKTEERELADVNELLPIPWNLVDVEAYIHSDMYINGVPRVLDIGQTSRGCPFNCGFCSQGRTKYRPMTAHRTIQMITETVERFKLDGIWIRDDEFYVRQDRVAKICEGIIPLGIRWYTSGTRIDIFNRTPDEQVLLYKRSGADTIKFGAESGNNRVLEFIGKRITVEDTIRANLRCRELGILPTYNLVAGFPTETLEETNDTIRMVTRLKRDNPRARFETIFLYTPLPNTPLWEVALEHGLQPPDKLEDWANWQFEEYDDEGTRLPWYDAKERQYRGNICYLASLSQVMPSLINGFDGSVKGKLLRTGYYFPHKYFDYRFSHLKYKHIPEMKMIRWGREKLFTKSDVTIR